MSLQYTPDITALEKKAGQDAARQLRRRLKLILATTTVKRTGIMLKSVGASAKMKFGVLDHIEVRASQATFIQHYGFEGIKKNGIRMNLKARRHVDGLFSTTKVLDKLIDKITDIRAEAIMQNIRF